MSAAGVIGWPVAHSRSPAIHRTWLARHGIAGRYDPIAVPPEEIDRFLAAFPQSGLVGANVTIPHKEAAARACRLDAAAEAVGAVNTLWLEEGRLCGTNSDEAGFLANLDESVPGWDAESRAATVLGAGGAARAVVHGLLGRGLERVTVVNRTMPRAVALSERFGDRVVPAPWADLASVLPGTDLLVNTTSLGMHGQAPLRIDLAALHPGAIVADIVYVPLDTDLLVAARARGLRAVDGLGMLLHQAAVGFERWFGIRPSVDADLRAVVTATLFAAGPGR